MPEVPSESVTVVPGGYGATDDAFHITAPSDDGDGPYRVMRAALMASVTCIVDDTFAGRVAGHYVASIGGTATMLALPGDSRRLEQVHALMRRRASCAFPVDGGGPYRRAGTGIIALAMTLDAAILPLSVSAPRAAPPLHRSGVRLPWLGSDVVAGVGSPIEVGRRGDRRRLAADLGRALDDLGAAVRR